MTKWKPSNIKQSISDRQNDARFVSPDHVFILWRAWVRARRPRRTGGWGGWRTSWLTQGRGPTTAGLQLPGGPRGSSDASGTAHGPPRLCSGGSPSPTLGPAWGHGAVFQEQAERIAVGSLTSSMGVLHFCILKVLQIYWYVAKHRGPAQEGRLLTPGSEETWGEGTLPKKGST